MKELDKVLTKYFRDKAPKLPEDLQKLIVQYGPYVLLLFLIVAGLNLLAAFGFTSLVFNPLTAFASSAVGSMYQIYLIFSVIIIVLQALALPGLFNRSIAGWNYIFYAALVGLVQNVVSFNIAGLIVGSGLSFYILYQIKHHYK